MNERRVILVGLGEAGFGWYRIVQRYGKLSLAVVDANPAMQEKLAVQELGAVPPFYTSLVEAIEIEQPQFIINVTPPHIHSLVNETAFQHGLPVLCEKPISYSFKESKKITALAEQADVPFMIAENYRNQAKIRKLKKCLESGRIGKLKSIKVEFHRDELEGRTYDVRLLNDIVVHHMDLLRFLTGCEGTAVFAEMPIPNRHIHIIVELSKDITAIYTALIGSKAKETPWHGDWTFVGTDGTIKLSSGSLIIKEKGKEQSIINEFSDIQHPNCLEQFVSYLQGGAVPETMAAEYLKTEALVYYAEQSIGQKQWATVE